LDELHMEKNYLNQCCTNIHRKNSDLTIRVSDLEGELQRTKKDN